MEIIINTIDNPKTDLDPSLELYNEIYIFSEGHNNDLLNDIEILD